MYAVIETGGKQVRVKPGDFIQVEKLEGDIGSAVQFKEVLFFSKSTGTESSPADISLGKPFVNNASVKAEIVGQGRGEKILIIKMKRRKQYRRMQGHRQFLTDLLVTEIDNGSGAQAELSGTEKTALLGKFHTQLRSKGLAHTPKTLGSRVRARGGLAQEQERQAARKNAKPATKKKTASKSKSSGAKKATKGARKAAAKK